MGIVGEMLECCPASAHPTAQIDLPLFEKLTASSHPKTTCSLVTEHCTAGDVESGHPLTRHFGLALEHTIRRIDFATGEDTCAGHKLALTVTLDEKNLGPSRPITNQNDRGCIATP
jgi:hypothetical protein